MTVKEQLQHLQKLSGLTQTELARRLGVTFVALNRWINAKVVPRSKAREKIDELYKEYTGEKQIPGTVLEAKKNLVVKTSDTHKDVVKKILDNSDIRDQFYLSLTYNSNRIEGSTLSEGDTAAILFQNIALPDKSLVEQLEAKNHQADLEFLFGHMAEKKPLDERFILRMHSILMNAIRSDAGRYRHHGVRIIGTYVPTANYLKVPDQMIELAQDINREHKDAIAHMTNIHSRFEKIHPFGDGNGRIGRLLMHAMALRVNLAPVVVLGKKRRLYVTYLNKAQMKDDQSLLEDFICDAILEGYRILDRDEHQ